MPKFSLLKSANAVTPTDALLKDTFNPPTVASRVSDAAGRAGAEIKRVATSVAELPGRAGTAIADAIGPVTDTLEFGDLKDENVQRQLLTQYLSNPKGKFESSVFGNSAADVVAKLNAKTPAERDAIFKARGMATPSELNQNQMAKLLSPPKEDGKPVYFAPGGAPDPNETKKFDWSRLIGPGVGAGAGYLLGNTLSGLADGEDEEENKRRARRLAVLGALGGGVAGYALT